MYKYKTVLGLIPARSGSKGLSGKNIKNFCNKPLIYWTIKPALASRCLDSVIVSTDSPKIAQISRKGGAWVPFLRPKYLAKDNSSTIDVILHALGFLKKMGKQYDLVMLLQPTSPLRSSEDIDNSIELLYRKKAKAVVSVCEAEHSPYWSNVLPADCNMGKFLRPEAENKNRQELPNFYRLNGAIYLADWNYLKFKKSFFGSKTYAYIMPHERSIDIDTQIDFKIAEFLKR